MFNGQQPKDREILTFPEPFRRMATPYQKYDFSKFVKEMCSSQAAVSRLKISKTIFLGDVSVGKTALIKRFCHGEFDKNYKATIGVDFEVERFDVLNVPFNIHIWDTAGQEKFKSIASSYYRGAHIIAVVFDVSRLITLSHCAQWIEDACNTCESNPHLFLIGTKLDLVDVFRALRPIVSHGRQWVSSRGSRARNASYLHKISSAALQRVIELAEIEARILGAELWVISSCTGENVIELFHRMAALAFDASIMGEKDAVSARITIGDINNIKKNGVTVSTSKDGKSKCAGCA